MSFVVLTTTDLFETDASSSTSELKYGRGELKVWSTGLLERVLAAGHEVIVVTTRTKLGNHDKWWLELVSADNVFLAAEPDPEVWRWRENERVSSGWMHAFERLGIPWPTNHGESGHWTWARNFLSANNILQAHDFRT